MRYIFLTPIPLRFLAIAAFLLFFWYAFDIEGFLTVVALLTVVMMFG